MLKVVKLIILFLFDSCFSFVKRIFRKVNPRILALIYHDVTPQWRQRFVRQLEMIEKYTTVIRAEKGSFPDKEGRYTAITFDDAFSCLMENVVPEMDKREIPWTLFVPTGYLGEHPRWDDWGPDWGDDSENYRVMDEKTLALLAQNPLITLGSHSVTHPRFTALGVEERRKEFADSRAKLEEIAGKKVDSFVFPYGDYEKNIVAQAREEGYENTFTIIPAYASLQDEEGGFGRMWVDPSDWGLEFFVKLMGAYRWIPWVHRIIPIP